MDINGLVDFLKGDSIGGLSVNPRILPEKRNSIVDSLGKVENWEKFLWLQSSGTSKGFEDGFKIVAFTKSNLLNSAQRVVENFNMNSKDRFLLSLPLFHIAGVSIVARAVYCGGDIIENLDSSWDPQSFVDGIKNDSISVLSLVPTQIFDIVKHGLKCPSDIRVVFVGGGGLSMKLARRARKLGWPLTTCYGMTETGAMIAVNRNPHQVADEYQVFKGTDIEIDPSTSFVKVSGSFISHGILHVSKNDWSWNLNEGKFLISDHLELNEGQLRFFGRTEEFVKILGESVNLSVLEKELELFLGASSSIVAFEDGRRGFHLVGVSEKKVSLDELKLFNSKREPFLHLRDLIEVEVLPRNDLGKIQKSKIRDWISNIKGAFFS